MGLNNRKNAYPIANSPLKEVQMRMKESSDSLKLQQILKKNGAGKVFGGHRSSN